MSRDFVGALLQLNAEKQISREQLIGAVEDGIQSAYRRVAGDEDIHVRIDAETGKIRVFRARRVVGEIEDEFTEITVDQAHAIQPDAGARRPRRDRAARRRRLRPDRRPDGQADRPPAHPRGRARPGLRPVREPRGRDHHRHRQPGRAARRSSSTSARTSRRSWPRPSSRALEHYRIGQNVKAFVLEVRRSTKGPQIFVSRTHKGFLRRLFELEVPEIHAGTVEIKAIAREAGSRSKVAVASRQEGSIRSAPPSASAAPASRPSSPSSAARRSTSSRGARTRRVRRQRAAARRRSSASTSTRRTASPA